MVPERKSQSATTTLLENERTSCEARFTAMVVAPPPALAGRTATTFECGRGWLASTAARTVAGKLGTVKGGFNRKAAGSASDRYNSAEKPTTAAVAFFSLIC